MHEMEINEQPKQPVPFERNTIGNCDECGGDLIEIEFKFKTLGKHKVYPVCKCKAKKYDDRIENEKKREEKIKLEQLFSQSRLGKRFYESTFDKIQITEHNSNILKSIKHYAENFNGKDSFILYSHPGTGKTLMAAAVANYLLSNYNSVIFITAPDLISKLIQAQDYQSQNKEWQIFEGLDTCKLLILDDLGAEQDNRQAVTKMFQIINNRYDNMKSMAFTTNLNSEQLIKRYGTRTYSRIYEMCTKKGMFNLDKEKDWRLDR